MTTIDARYEAMLSFVNEIADRDCDYGDGCPTLGARHGRCLPCQARTIMPATPDARSAAADAPIGVCNRHEGEHRLTSDCLHFSIGETAGAVDRSPSSAEPLDHLLTGQIGGFKPDPVERSAADPAICLGCGKPTDGKHIACESCYRRAIANLNASLNRDRAAVARSPDGWREEMWAIHTRVTAARNVLAGSVWDVRFLTLGLCGEIGELANLIKKEWRDGASTERRPLIEEEFADVRAYLYLLGRALGIDEEKAIAQHVIQKCRDRWPDPARSPEEKKP